MVNNTGMDLKAVMLLAGDSKVMIGDLKNGEKVEVLAEDNQTFYSFYDIVDIPGIDRYTDLYTRISRSYEDIYDKYVRVGSYGNNAIAAGKVYIFAFCEDDWKCDYVKDRNVKEYHAMVYLKADDISYEGYQDAKVLNLRDYAVYNEDWDSYDGQLYETEVDVVVNFLGEINDIYYLNCQENYHGHSADTKVYMLNMETGEFDELFTDGTEMEFPDGCPYIKDTTMYVRFACNNPWDDYVPEITIVGGK